MRYEVYQFDEDTILVKVDTELRVSRLSTGGRLRANAGWFRFGHNRLPPATGSHSQLFRILKHRCNYSVPRQTNYGAAIGRSYK